MSLLHRDTSGLQTLNGALEFIQSEPKRSQRTPREAQGAVAKKSIEKVKRVLINI